MGVQHPGSGWEEVLPDEIDQALHRFTFVNRVGHHALQPGTQTNRGIGLFRGHAIDRIGVVLFEDNIVLGDRRAQFNQVGSLLRDIQDLGPCLLRCARSVDPDHVPGAAIFLQSRRPCRRA